VTRGFRRVRGEMRVRLGDGERRVLHDVFTEVHDLLRDPSPGPAEDDPLAALVGIGQATKPPDDPALARLLPDAHKDDPVASAEFRRYTENELRSRKRNGLRLAMDTLDRGPTLHLHEAEAAAWVVALTDVRLVLAERIGLRTDDDHALLERVVADLADDDADASGEPGPAERLAVTLSLYDFLAWLQETLVVAMAETLPDEGRRDAGR
jgi:Domain of unknown function (DUF2017)